MSHVEHHVSSIKLLTTVFGGLVFLTVFTVLTAQLDLGPLNVPLALLIATTKAALVVIIFMALKWDNKVNTAIFGIGVLFVFVFISFTLFDTLFRGDLTNTVEGTIQDQMIQEEAMKAREPASDAIQFNRTPQ
ncbi:cytochrome C oxidase subunit IV family protein [bacterium]|nr:cytochrome C oxidase subunit IV family protein [bacterium]